MVGEDGCLPILWVTLIYDAFPLAVLRAASKASRCCTRTQLSLSLPQHWVLAQGPMWDWKQGGLNEHRLWSPPALG